MLLPTTDLITYHSTSSSSSCSTYLNTTYKRAGGRQGANKHQDIVKVTPTTSHHLIRRRLYLCCNAVLCLMKPEYLLLCCCGAEYLCESICNLKISSSLFPFPVKRRDHDGGSQQPRSWASIFLMVVKLTLPVTHLHLPLLFQRIQNQRPSGRWRRMEQRKRN